MTTTMTKKRFALYLPRQFQTLSTIVQTCAITKGDNDGDHDRTGWQRQRSQSRNITVTTAITRAKMAITIARTPASNNLTRFDIYLRSLVHRGDGRSAAWGDQLVECQWTTVSVTNRRDETLWNGETPPTSATKPHCQLHIQRASWVLMSRFDWWSTALDGPGRKHVHINEKIHDKICEIVNYKFFLFHKLHGYLHINNGAYL